MPCDPRPVTIVGGGLAGLALGAALVRRHIPTTVIDAGAYPRHRVCGEFLVGLDAGTVRGLSLAPQLADALRHSEITWHSPSGVMGRQHLRTPALAISRHALDQRLANALLTAGGNLQVGTRVNSDSVEGQVWATGRKGNPRSPWLGLKVHAWGMDVATPLEMHTGRNAYVGLAGLDGSRVNICGLFKTIAGLKASRGEWLLRYLEAAGLTQLARRVSAAQCDPASFCAVSGIDFAPPRAGDRRIRIGDAWATPPPYTGNGMAAALQGAHAVLEPLTRWSHGELSWTDTARIIDRRLRNALGPRLRYARFLHPFIHRPIGRPGLWIAHHSGLTPWLHHFLH